jgi:hypothetical protein
MRASLVPWLICAAWITFGATPLSATTYTVNPHGTGDFPTIQAAIAACIDGDVVELTDGEFTGDGNREIDFLGKAITLRSQSGNAMACVINCEGTHQDPHRGLLLVSGEGPDTRIEEITVSEGFGMEPGGGIVCDGSSPTIIGCRVIGCASDVYDSGGIYCVNAEPLIEDCRILSCAGGIYCTNSPAVVRGCRFDSNTACNSGAITAVSSEMTVEECTFVANIG